MENELWLTKIFNDHLAGVGNALLGLAKQPTNPRPWSNWIVMEFLTIAIMVVLFAVLKRKLSVDKPGKIQHMFEVIYLFVKETADEIGIHHGEKYIPYFGTLFIFILFMNLLGLVPTFESPTMYVVVPLGLALATFVYYHYHGVRELGLLGYLKQFLGPIWYLFIIMIPLEIISHLARPLSLTVRLYANMFAGEQVTGAFLGLTKIGAPAIFMALHVFVAILQAYIFMLLAMIYVNLATSHEH